MKNRLLPTLLFALTALFSHGATLPSFDECLRTNIATKAEIDVFLHGQSWAKFDPDVGYILGNWMPHDGVDQSSTISTVQPNRARTSFLYASRPCRINTYGNSFTQCHQVNDGETWQEYLAAHFGEPVRNFGMGGYGVYQSYRRMLQEEKTPQAAEYLVFYIWGDDGIRSLLRCRYAMIKPWMKRHEATEGVGAMFHGNFWPNIEMDLETGQLVERDSPIRTPEQLYQMTDPEWMHAQLKGDLALQMGLFLRGQTSGVDVPTLKRLARCLDVAADLDDPAKLKDSVTWLLDQYSFAATKHILRKVRAFAEENGKKVMIVLFDPNRTFRTLVADGTRYDQEIVDFLRENNFTCFDMSPVHVEDFKKFNLTLDQYFKRFFHGHYIPMGNHFFAFAIKDRLVGWLDPKPVTYRETSRRSVDFKDYLEGH